MNPVNPYPMHYGNFTSLISMFYTPLTYTAPASYGNHAVLWPGRSGVSWLNKSTQKTQTSTKANPVEIWSPDPGKCKLSHDKS